MTAGAEFAYTIRDALLKIAALFSYCGGPLFIADLLKPHLDKDVASLLTFVPVGFMVIGAYFLEDVFPDRLSSAAVWVGRLSLYVVIGMHVFAFWRFANGVRVPDQRLHYIGITVGVLWSFAYLRAAGRR